MSRVGRGDDFTAGDELAPPMVNGEVVFDEPWQGRVFGMARAMAVSGAFEWEEFRSCLIAELARVEPAEVPFEYYPHFLRALETVLVRKGLLASDVIRERALELAARPHGHDHRES